MIIMKNFMKYLTKTQLLAGVLALVSVNISGLLAYKTSKSKAPIKTKIRNWIWVILSIAYPVFIWVMELHCFWKL